MSDIHNVGEAELRSAMFSPRTAKYVRAMIREGDNFDYCRWLGRVREEEAQAKQASAALSSDELVGPEIGNLTNTPGRLDAWANTEPALRAKLAPFQGRVPDQITKPAGKVPKIGLGES